MTGNTKTVKIMFTVTEEENKKIIDAANFNFVSRTAYVRQAVLQMADWLEAKRKSKIDQMNAEYIKYQINGEPLNRLYKEDETQ